MIGFISEIVERFGARLPGSLEEKAAQLLVYKKLRQFCTKVYSHEFENALNAKFNSLFVFGLFFFISLGLYWYSITAAMVVAFLNLFMFLGHFVFYWDWLDIFYQKIPSSNVIGTLDPKEEIKSTILISAHIDSTKEFFWFYWLKSLGMILFILAGILLLLLPLFYLTLYTFPNSFSKNINWSFYIWTGFAVLSPAMLSFLKVYSRKIFAEGCTDNLSGLSIAIEAVKNFVEPETSKSKLKNTRLMIASFGSEESGLKGSHEYLKSYANELKEENIVAINLDTIADPNEIAILKGELMTLAFFNRKVTKNVMKAFDEAGVAYKNKFMPVGATDATSFQRFGIPVVSITGVSMDKLDPVYHTRLDNLENLNSAGMEAVLKGIVKFIDNTDTQN